MTQPQRICHGWKGLKDPSFLHVGNWRPYCIRVLWPLLTRVSIVIYCLVPFLYTQHPIVDELVSPCSKVKISSSPPLASSVERTLTLPSDAAHKWADPLHPLAWDHAGDPPQDPLPLPDPEPEPDELEELLLDP